MNINAVTLKIKLINLLNNLKEITNYFKKKISNFKNYNKYMFKI